MNWVTIKKFSELSGYTEDAIRSKISTGVWLEGAVWKHAPDNRVLISMKGYDLWVEEKVCAPQAQRASKLISGSAA